MRESQVRELREETEHMFFHGFEGYMNYAFPEDELRPVSCRPLTRDRENPAHIELNDVLGNYSLTLVDSLSTLAILASPDTNSGRKAWNYFQDGVKDLVGLYGDGTEGRKGKGTRARGFDVDSKVQVFETVIRGVGGLLSAHLFAVGDLPVRGYEPPEMESEFAKAWDKEGLSKTGQVHGIRWDNGFVYDGQLLRLAVDLAKRILPAFYTPTGLPYPRVNLRHGVPFYENSPFNAGRKSKTRGASGGRPELTETCSAGAGSLVLEFSVLSRLTGDRKFENLAKRAFWAVWQRRTEIGLIGAGIDAETGQWVNSYTGIGAGIDSFFEYAFKSHILLSAGEPPSSNSSSLFNHLDNYYSPLSPEDHSAVSFLRAWEEGQSSVKHHLYRGESYQHPHYIQGDIYTGATRAFWIDSLSAYYPGLLTLAGDVEQAIEIHLLATAVWTRFSGLPERWNVASGDIEGGLVWWGGRPEFIESNYYLYRATEDPWYLYVGEMTLRDIKRRCWTRCGLAGIQDVRNGELSDRMESFFLGETAKYLYLLFEPTHPLNHLDAPFVFTTEGHPLVIPKSGRKPVHSDTSELVRDGTETTRPVVGTCPAPPEAPPFSKSSTAARPDVFHAASLARLDLMPKDNTVESALFEYASDHPSVTLSDLISPSNYTFFPWTLPLELIPSDATSAPMSLRPIIDISFPKLPNTILGPGSLERVPEGVLIKSIGGLRFGMVQDVPLVGMPVGSEGFRIQVINNVPLGKDEKVFIPAIPTLEVLNPTDPNFTQNRDSAMLDIVIDMSPEQPVKNASATAPSSPSTSAATESPVPLFDESTSKVAAAYTNAASNVKTAMASLMSHVSSILREESLFPSDGFSRTHSSKRISIPAITSIGMGAAPVPDVEEASFSFVSDIQPDRPLSWSSIYISDETCDQRLPSSVPKNHQVIVMKRGGCSFSEKLKNIPAFRPAASSLQLVIIVSYDGEDGSDVGTSQDRAPKEDLESGLVRPLLDETQVIAGGMPRYNPISMVLVDGGAKTYDNLRRAVGLGIKWRYHVSSRGTPISNLFVL
ncbi:alpha mannosidase-like protein [Arachnomyces sp. PD_36]|nr:alpha mannosidase-like protein [Arachnomyces sp. PD_36]